MENQAFVKRLEEQMHRKNYTNKSLSKDIKVSAAAIGNYKKGRIPDGEILPRLARALDVSTDYLLGITDFPSIDNDARIVNSATGLSLAAIESLQEIKKASVSKDNSCAQALPFLSALLENKDSLIEIASLYYAYQFVTKGDASKLNPEKVLHLTINDNELLPVSLEKAPNYYKYELWRAFTEFADK